MHHSIIAPPRLAPLPKTDWIIEDTDDRGVMAVYRHGSTQYRLAPSFFGLSLDDITPGDTLDFLGKKAKTALKLLPAFKKASKYKDIFSGLGFFGNQNAIFNLEMPEGFAASVKGFETELTQQMLLHVLPDADKTRLVTPKMRQTWTDPKDGGKITLIRFGDIAVDSVYFDFASANLPGLEWRTADGLKLVGHDGPTPKAIIMGYKTDDMDGFTLTGETTIDAAENADTATLENAPHSPTRKARKPRKTMQSATGAATPEANAKPKNTAKTDMNDHSAVSREVGGGDCAHSPYIGLPVKILENFEVMIKETGEPVEVEEPAFMEVEGRYFNHGLDGGLGLTEDQAHELFGFPLARSHKPVHVLGEGFAEEFAACRSQNNPFLEVERFDPGFFVSLLPNGADFTTGLPPGNRIYRSRHHTLPLGMNHQRLAPAWGHTGNLRQKARDSLFITRKADVLRFDKLPFPFGLETAKNLCRSRTTTAESGRSSSPGIRCAKLLLPPSKRVFPAFLEPSPSYCAGVGNGFRGSGLFNPEPCRHKRGITKDQFFRQGRWARSLGVKSQVVHRANGGEVLDASYPSKYLPQFLDGFPDYETGHDPPPEKRC